jgi:hypothetical protein
MERGEKAEVGGEDEGELVGLERFKHGLSGYSAGPTEEFLEELKRAGEDGRWNATDAEERARPWRPYSDLWMPGVCVCVRARAIVW